jgi:competence protein ComEA
MALLSGSFGTAATKSDTTSRSTTATPVRSGKVDINTASQAELESLPGVGPQTAKAIIDARPFSSVSDLERVSGIGEQKMKDLRGMVTASRAKAPRKVESASTSTSSRSSSNDRVAYRTTTTRINLNTASKEELESLPEIGPVKAQAIIDARPFKNTEDVMRVKGIKEGTYEVIRDKITVR